MLDRAFFERSPRLYMRTPQATAQYGQVLRVSVARASLNSRTSAIAAVGEKPSRARLEPARVALVTFRNSRRVTSAMAIPLHACRRPKSIPLGLVSLPAGPALVAVRWICRTGTPACLFVTLRLPRNAAKTRRVRASRGSRYLTLLLGG